MTFEEAVATQALWIQLWVNWMGIALVGTFVVLLFSRKTWRDAAVLLVSTGVMFFFMQWLYAQAGYVRLLGLPHIVIWTPLAIYLFWRIRKGGLGPAFRIAMGVLLVTITASLAIDYVDVARYLLGERGSLVPGQ